MSSLVRLFGAVLLSLGVSAGLSACNTSPNSDPESERVQSSEQTPAAGVQGATEAD